MSTNFAEKYFDNAFAEDIDALGHERGKVEFKTVVVAARMVDQSGVLEIVAEERALEHLGKGPGGRKALVNDRAILVVLLVLALEHQALHLTLARDMVINRLGKDSLRYLDLNMGNGTEEQVYHRLTRASTRFVSPVNPHEGPRRKKLKRAEHIKLEASRDPEKVAAKNVRLHVAMNRLIAASVKMLPQAVAETFKGDFAIDGTFVKATGKRGTDKFGGQYVAAEYDAGRHFREGNHGAADNPGKAKKKSSNVWGFEMHTATMIRENMNSRTEYPLLIAAVAWDAPAGQPGQNALLAFQAVRDQGLPLTSVVADRAYYAGAAVHNFHEQMFDWDVKPVTDYKDIQLGVQAECHGALQVEGTWYCPSMPAGLVSASIDFRRDKADPKKIDFETYIHRIEARQKWAAVRKSRPDQNGTVRWSHPTGLGERCKGEDKFCTQTTISQPREVGLKFAQEYPYMSKEWRDRYPLRNSVESTNATLKRGTTHNLSDPERRRARGRAWQFVLASLVVVAANIKKIRDFEKTGKKRAKLDAIKSNRKRVPFGYSTMNEDQRTAIDENRRE